MHCEEMPRTVSVIRLISPYKAVYRQPRNKEIYPSSRKNADDELRLCLGSIASLGESLTKSHLNTRSIGPSMHNRRISIANVHLPSTPHIRQKYPGIHTSIAQFLDECLDGSNRHIANRSKADDGPRPKFSPSTDLLPDQIPHAVLRSQQPTATRALVVLDLRNGEDTSVNDGGFGFDFKTPVAEVLLSAEMKEE